jgi:putative transcriptional regulator
VTDVRPGTFLVASPTLQDPNFARTVVLVCEHSDQGSMGLVVNRPSTVPLAEALGDAAPPSLPPTPLFLGGPVQRQALLALHRLPDAVPDSQAIADGMSIGGDVKLLLDALGKSAGGSPGPHEERVRSYAGYAGWGSGQLAAELEQGSWIVCPGTAAQVFAPDVEHLWEQVLRGLGPDYARLVTVPLDPRVN